MDSPWVILSTVVLYLYFVQDLGPSLMAKRKAFNLHRVMQVYNVVQIVVCTYLIYKAMILSWLVDFNFMCHVVDYSPDPRQIEIARTVWMYFMVKVFDLLDTVFFVLRKKEKQISFLHVYHHAGMAFGTWTAVKFLPGGHFIFLGTINSFVHVVMYSYYLATSFRMDGPWWKKYITQLQLVQFCLLLLHDLILAFHQDCGFPKWTVVVLIPQNLFMMMMFGDFYYKCYIKKPQRKSSQNGVAAEATNGKLKHSQ